MNLRNELVKMAAARVVELEVARAQESELQKQAYYQQALYNEELQKQAYYNEQAELQKLAMNPKIKALLALLGAGAVGGGIGTGIDALAGDQIGQGLQSAGEGMSDFYENIGDWAGDATGNISDWFKGEDAAFGSYGNETEQLAKAIAANG